MAISKGGDNSAETTRRDNSIFWPTEASCIFQTTRPRVATASFTAFAKNVKPCVVIYVYLIFNFFAVNSARVKHARHKDDRGDTKMIVKRSLLQGWSKWQNFSEFKNSKATTGTERQQTAGNFFRTIFFGTSCSSPRVCWEYPYAYGYSLLEIKNLDGLLAYTVLRT